MRESHISVLGTEGLPESEGKQEGGSFSLPLPTAKCTSNFASLYSRSFGVLAYCRLPLEKRRRTKTPGGRHEEWLKSEYGTPEGHTHPPHARQHEVEWPTTG